MKKFLVRVYKRDTNETFTIAEVSALDKWSAVLVMRHRISSERKHSNQWNNLLGVDWWIDAVEL